MEARCHWASICKLSVIAASRASATTGPVISSFGFDALVNFNSCIASKTKHKADDSCGNPECRLFGIRRASVGEEEDSRQNCNEDTNVLELF